MSHECEFRSVVDVFVLNSFAVFGVDVEEIPLSQEGLADPPVGIHTVNSDSVIFSVNYDSLVETCLVQAKIPIHEGFVNITALDYLYSVCIDHPGGSNGPGVKLIKIIHERPLSRLAPVALAEVVLVNDVLVVLEPESENHLY